MSDDPDGVAVAVARALDTLRRRAERRRTRGDAPTTPLARERVWSERRARLRAYADRLERDGDGDDDLGARLEATRWTPDASSSPARVERGLVRLLEAASRADHEGVDRAVRTLLDEDETEELAEEVEETVPDATELAREEEEDEEDDDDDDDDEKEEEEEKKKEHDETEEKVVVVDSVDEKEEKVVVVDSVDEEENDDVDVDVREKKVNVVDSVEREDDHRHDPTSNGDLAVDSVPRVEPTPGTNDEEEEEDDDDDDDEGTQPESDEPVEPFQHHSYLSEVQLKDESFQPLVSEDGSNENNDDGGEDAPVVVVDEEKEEEEEEDDDDAPVVVVDEEEDDDKVVEDGPEPDRATKDDDVEEDASPVADDPPPPPPPSSSEPRPPPRPEQPQQHPRHYLNYTLSHDGMVGVEAVHDGDDEDDSDARRANALVARGVDAAATVDGFRASSPRVADEIGDAVANGDDAALVSRIHATVSRTLSSVFSATEHSVETGIERKGDARRRPRRPVPPAVDAENLALVRRLYSHLAPYGVLSFDDGDDDHDDERLAWVDTEEEEDPGYVVVPLTKTKLLELETDFQTLVEARLDDAAAASARRDDDDDDGRHRAEEGRRFRTDLAAAEDLLEKEERRARAVAESVALGGNPEEDVVAPRPVPEEEEEDDDDRSKGDVENASPAPSSDSRSRAPSSNSSSSPAVRPAAAPPPPPPPPPPVVAGPPGLEHVRPIGAGEEGGLEQFALPIVYNAFQTGFEPTKDLVLEPGTVVAGRYLVESELGSAAFSTAYRCVDMAASPDDYYCEVCLKVIKNTKDFFDQSLDEIKVLELLRQTGECEEHNIVEMRSFFYFKEHLIIVTELLRQNLFEFGKFILENNEVPYFSLARLCFITRQILVGLDFVHSLGLVHSDVKPENILIASYSRARVKIIDFGSSCFVTDRQSSYIQSRSYRAPEVVLGLPYDGRIDVWSLGCVVAEMFTGRVTFQNRSVVSMLSRMEAVCGPFPRHLIANGRHSSKFFTPNGLVYEGVDRRRGRDRRRRDDDDDDDKDGTTVSDTYEGSDEEDEERSSPRRGEETNTNSTSRDDDDDDEEWFHVYRPKRTTLAERLTFDADLMERPRDTLEDEEKALFTDFVRSLLTIDPGCRPTAAEALRHPWILSGANLTEEDVKYTPDES